MKGFAFAILAAAYAAKQTGGVIAEVCENQKVIKYVDRMGRPKLVKPRPEILIIRIKVATVGKPIPMTKPSKNNKSKVKKRFPPARPSSVLEKLYPIPVRVTIATIIPAHAQEAAIGNILVIAF